MKQLRIEIDDEIDAALDALAVSERTPKEAIVRRMVADGVRLAKVRDPLDDLIGRYDAEPGDANSTAVHDPLDAIVGSVDVEPVDDIDEVIYGR